MNSPQRLPFYRPPLGNDRAAADMSFVPSLTITETGRLVRLELGGFARGEGHSLQEAADDLVRSVLRIVLAFRTSGVRVSTEIRPDHETMGFIHELGDLAAAGKDIRPALFG